EKDCAGHRDPRCGKRNIKDHNEKRTCDQHPDSRDPEIGTSETRTQLIGDNAAQKRRDQTSNYSDQSEDRPAHGWALISIFQIRRYPISQTTGYKSHQCLCDAVDEIRACSEKPQVIPQAATRRFLHEVMCGNARIALPETEQTQQQTRRRHEIKCPAPAEVSTDQAADDIAQRAADWNGSAKNRHDSAARFNREKIG